MGYTRTGADADGAVRIAVPNGWVEVEPSRQDRDRGTIQLITVAAWDQVQGLRPSMSVTVTPPSTDHIAARVLAEAQGLAEPHVMSIDRWAINGTDPVGRRLTIAHTDGDASMTTLVWAATTAAGDVVVAAHAESRHLHLHDGAFAAAMAGIQVPAGPAADAPSAADLLGRARPTAWAEVAPALQQRKAAMVADPDARILVEASVGTTNLRFDATLAGGRATVSATASPREVPQDPGAATATTTLRMPVNRLALAVAQWLGLGPARTPATRPVEIPLNLVMRRLLDPGVPTPAGADTTTWRQPWFLWTLRSSATDSGLVMIDAGASGQCAVMETDDEQTTRFAPLSSYNVWLTINWLVSESLG
jgi:hypothetical protein